MMKRKILITGVSGLLGNNLCFHFRKKSRVYGTFYNHPVCIEGAQLYGVDLRNYDETRRLAKEICPDVVIHCASRTDVDKMEEDREGAWQANVLATRTMVDALRDVDCKIVYISTDSVYGGSKGPYKESDAAEPCNWYGRTKLDGETVVRGEKRPLILRTNLYGWNIQEKESLSEWFLSRLRSGKETIGFSDARFSSIYTFSLARIINECIEKNIEGVYNCACRDACSKFDFGKRIAGLFNFDDNLILGGSIASANLKARRGHDLRLDVSKLETVLGRRFPDIDESLREFHSDWKDGFPSHLHRDRGKCVPGNFFPTRKKISYGSQAIDGQDINAVVRVMRSEYLTQGNEVSAFEEEVARYVGARHAVVVNSGTAGLHLANLACGLGKGEEGITSPVTFLASANSIVYCGAIPKFADIDPKTYNVSPETIENQIKCNTRIVMPVHFGGQSCDMREIQSMVKRKETEFGKKIFIIEDASHALGSEYRERRVGCCEFSDAAIFSFHPVKHITTAEGGIVVTNDRRIADHVRCLRSHGMTKVPERFIHGSLAFDRASAVNRRNPEANLWYYEQHHLGFNYRLTDMQCALGRSQLKKLGWFIARRREIVRRYNDAFSDLGHCIIPFEKSDGSANFHLYVLQIDFPSIGLTRLQFMKRLERKGVQSQVHYIPVHLQPFYQERYHTRQGDCPNAEQYYGRCLSIPLYPMMSDTEVEKVVQSVRDLLRGGE